MSANKPFRLMTTKDIKEVLDISIRHAQRIANKILEIAGKKRPQKITVQEFCDYHGHTVEYVFEKLGWKY
jgi:hypothetical protein